MEIIEEQGPCVILATSGMLVGGASVEYFKLLADNPKNMLIFICYQGTGSTGYKVQRGDKEIMLNGKEVVNVKMNIETIDGLTGHSGRNELLKFISNLSPTPKRVVINHGESSRCLDLASTIHKMQKIETNAPKNLESVRIK